MHTQEENVSVAPAASIEALIYDHTETTTLAKALDAAGLDDAAFAVLPAGTVEALLRPENAEVLTGLLRHHLIGSATEEGNATLAEVLNDDELVVQHQMEADNGTIYVINRVLLPVDFDPASLTGNN